MRGLALHENLAKARFLGEFKTKPDYRLYSINDEHPGMFRVEAGGIAVPGELYEMSDDVRAAVEAGEPPNLYIGPVELEDDRIVDGVLFPREIAQSRHKDISDFGGWRAYIKSLGD